MRHLLRRQFLLASAALPVAWAFAAEVASRSAQDRLEQLERDLGGRLGLFALDSADGAWLGHRADEPFPLCSTFKAILAAAILQRSTSTAGLLEQRINYAQSSLVEYSPITERHLAGGMTVAELCAAAIQYSDNTAANLLMELLGGPTAVTEFALSIGDSAFRLDRWETELNTAIPGDPRDTTTPSAMGRSLQRLVLGDALGVAQRQQLADWLLGNTTGAARIRAGVPSEWQVGDKTGTGVYGTANDVAVLWPPQRSPIIVAIYTTRHEQDAEARNDVIAAAARVVVDWLDTKAAS
ncbi:Beta-lactamase Toho-1 [compost metagenome]